MWPLGRKSKEEKEFERKLRIREALTKLDKYMEDARRISREYEKQAVEAKRFGNDALAKRFASKMLILDRQIKRAKTLQLIIKDLELSREQTGLLKVFVDVANDFSEALSEAEPTAKMASEIKKNVESAVAKTRRIDIILAEVVDSISDTLLAAEGVKEEEMKNALDRIEAKAAEIERAKVRKKTPEEIRNKPFESVDIGNSDVDKRIKKIGRAHV